jgi:hypothetical protein
VSTRTTADISSRPVSPATCHVKWTSNERVNHHAEHRQRADDGEDHDDASRDSIDQPPRRQNVAPERLDSRSPACSVRRLSGVGNRNSRIIGALISVNASGQSGGTRNGPKFASYGTDDAWTKEIERGYRVY